MSRLRHLSNTKQEARKRSRKKVGDTSIPTYTPDGKVIDPGRTKKRRALLRTVFIVAAAAAFIYIPGMFMNEQEQTSIYVASPDSSAIQMVNQLVRDSAGEDFDGDGVLNADETAAGSNPWLADTDFDGMSDYYEIYVEDSDPTVFDRSMVGIQQRQDTQNGNSLSSPYKIGNVVLWAGDYTSKAYGSVVETLHGYHFCNFSGYAQFSEYDTCYAYKVENGVRTLLEHRERENAWRINAGDFVEVYEAPLDTTIEVSLFGNTLYLEPNAVTSVLARILPDKGFVTMQEKTRADVNPTGETATVVDIARPEFDSSSSERFTANTNTLADLEAVYNTIDEGGCVAVSLFNERHGEYICLAYGYDTEGNLLMADADSLEPIGTLQVTPQARKMINSVGSIVSVTYFSFEGFGFNSGNFDRISFFAQTGTVSHIGDTSSSGQDEGSNSESRSDVSVSSESSGEASSESSSGEDLPTVTPTVTPSATPTATPSSSATPSPEESGTDALADQGGADSEGAGSSSEE